jgi:hypothetical protein
VGASRSARGRTRADASLVSQTLELDQVNLKMQPYIPFIAFGLGVLITAGVATLIYLQRERDFKTLIAVWAELLGTRDGEYTTLADRAFVIRNLPPSKVDANAEYEERKEAERIVAAERAERGPKPSRIGPLDSAQLEATMKARREQGSSIN